MPPLRAIESVAEAWAPSVEHVVGAAESKLSECVGKELFGQQAELPLLSRRRYLRRDRAEELENLSTDEDWHLRKQELSEAIARRIEQPRLTGELFWQPLEAFAAKDRPLVQRLLEHSAGTVNEAGLKASLTSVADKLQEMLPSPGQIDLTRRLYAASPASPGNVLAYLYSKSIASGERTSHFDYRYSLSQPSSVVIFDSLADMSSTSRDAVRCLDSWLPVVAVDLTGFERLPNFLDYARGQPSVVAKLQGLLEQTKRILADDSRIGSEEAVQRVVHGDFDQSVSAFNAAKSSNSPTVRTVRPDLVDPDVALRRIATPQQIADQLEMRFPENSGARIMAAEMLAENGEFYTLGSLVPKLKDLEYVLNESARQRGLNASNDIFVVGTEAYQASSDGLMTYLYKKTAELSDDRVVNVAQLRALARTGQLHDRRVVALDDAIYNGWQADDVLYHSLGSYQHAAIAALSSFSRFARRMDEGRAADQSARELITLQTDFSLSVGRQSDQIPLHAAMTPAERELLHAVAPWTISSMKVFPHMISDTTPNWFRRFTENFGLTFVPVSK